MKTVLPNLMLGIAGICLRLALVLALVLATLGESARLPALFVQNANSETSEESRPESKSEEADDVVLAAAKTMRRFRKTANLRDPIRLGFNEPIALAGPGLLPVPNTSSPTCACQLGAGINLRC